VGAVAEHEAAVPGRPERGRKPALQRAGHQERTGGESEGEEPENDDRRPSDRR